MCFKEAHDFSRSEYHPACELNRLACNHISDGNLDEAKEILIEAIHIASNLAAPYTNLDVLAA